ncbi:hypothetical protein ACLB2K_055768 [Fragaria x ananassa]
MSDELSNWFFTVLAICEGGRVAFGFVTDAVVVHHIFFVVRHRLLSLKCKNPEPRTVIGTFTLVLDLKNRLQICAQGEQFILRFTNQEERRHIVNKGSCCYGKSLFVLNEFDGLCDVARNLITTFFGVG